MSDNEDNHRKLHFINGSVAERSKAADSSSVIVRCACSNHAGVIIFLNFVACKPKQLFLRHPFYFAILVLDVAIQYLELKGQQGCSRNK